MLPSKHQPQKNLIHAQSPFILKLSCPLFSFCCQWRNIIKHISISFWTGPCKEVVWSLYLCCLFLASVVARSPHDHVSLCRPTPPRWEGTVTQHCARPGVGTHVHTDAHTQNLLSISCILDTKKPSCSVFLASSCWETRSSGQIWSMWWPEI